jgi:ribosomal-protein-alanine N-acetyltransferase
MNTTEVGYCRWMVRRDMPEVLAIESLCFERPWTEEDFIRPLRQNNCIGMVIEAQEQIHGFMLYELHKNELRLLNFAVHPASQRQGFGAAMIRKLVSKLSQQMRRRIVDEVRETNLPMQLFLRSQGFQCIGVNRNAFDDTGED